MKPSPRPPRRTSSGSALGRLRHVHLRLDRPLLPAGRRARPALARHAHRLDRPHHQPGPARARPTGARRGRRSRHRRSRRGAACGCLGPRPLTAACPARSATPACICAAPTRPTTARGRWRSPGRRTGRSSPHPQQTAGRGRQGRRWSAPPERSLLASLVLRCPAAAAAADRGRRRMRRRRSTDQVANDVVSSSRARVASHGAGPTARDHRLATAGAGDLAKLAGILAEGRPQDGWAVLGIGLNVAVRARRAAAGAARHRRHARRAARADRAHAHASAGGARRPPGRAGGEDARGPTAHATRCADARSPGLKAAAAPRASTARAGWWSRWRPAATPRSTRARCT